MNETVNGIQESSVVTKMHESSTDYLAEYDAAPEDQKFPLARKWMDTEPLPFFKQLREQRPILVTPEATFITLFNDVRDVLQMPKIFTAQLYEPKMNEYLMKHDDDAFHEREKSIMQSLLNRNDLPHVRNIIARNAKEILDKAGGNIEIVNEYCRAVPASLVQDYFGYDRIDRKTLVEWSYWTQFDTFQNHPFNLHSEERSKYIVEQHNRVSDEFGKYMALLTARRLVAVKADQAKGMVLFLWYGLMKLVHKLFGSDKYEVKDDITSRILRTSFPDEVEFNLVRKGINAGGLLIGAIETTQQAVAQVIEFFLKDPALRNRAQKAAQLDDPAEFDALVWEALRFVPISPILFRKVSQEIAVAKGTDHETTIMPGTNVLIATQSAMFDEYAYDNPDQFQPHRNWYHHFNFGFGAHECLGKHIGGVMIPEMVRQVMLLDDVKGEGEIDYKDTPFPEAYQLVW